MSSGRRFAGLLCLVVLAGGCAGVDQPLVNGANVLQDAGISFESASAGQSMQRLAEIGADHAAIVVFMEQPAPDSPAPALAGHVTDAQLRAGLRHARQAGLSTVLKPLVLVEGSWAGAIAPPSEQAWFAGYRENLLHYARIAEQEDVSVLVVGTELAGLSQSREWGGVIEAVRTVYAGRLAYAAHGAGGVERFGFWNELDVIGVTLYPALEEKGEAPDNREAIRRELRAVARAAPGPVWIMEFGVPSADGGLESPWDWRRLQREDVAANPEDQRRGLEAWLDVLDAGRAEYGIQQVTLWSWTSNPGAGGMNDKGYTPQNKPAEKLLACRWAGDCPVNGNG